MESQDFTIQIQRNPATKQKMSGTESNAAATNSSPASDAAATETAAMTKDETLGGAADESSYASFFECCVCLDLLYKPIVLACGHISCFWCVHKVMHGLRASHCALCRKPYIHFPSICQLLHLLILKLEPEAYKRRESEMLEEEKRLDVFSPQLGDSVIPKDNPDASEEIERSSEDLDPGRSIVAKESSSSENGVEDRKRKHLSVSDVLCSLCKELLYQPAVLNCGHVFCESCLPVFPNEPLKCSVCQSLHPGEFPNVCLDLDHFLEEQFPREYAIRKERARPKGEGCRHGEASSSALHEKKGEQDEYLLLEEDFHNVHVGVGCDSCGMYPIIGKRYRCKDCKELIGF